jgi:hypothetical protein
LDQEGGVELADGDFVFHWKLFQIFFKGF